MAERHAIKYLAPSWFAVIMGTGGLANVLYQWQNGFSAGHILGVIFAALADVLYFVVLVPWIIRWVSFFKYAQRDLHHPVTSNFFVKSCPWPLSSWGLISILFGADILADR